MEAGHRIDGARSHHHDAPAMVTHPLQHLLDRPLPDLSFPSSQGDVFRFRQYVGQRPLVLFFYIRNSTPG